MLFGVALSGVASVAACSGDSASRPDFLPPLRRFEGLQAEVTRNAAGRTCVSMRLGESELSSGCQPEGLRQSVTYVGEGNFKTVQDRAPGGTDFSAFALDFDDIVYRFEDTTKSGSIATSGLGYLIVLTPGITSQNADWRIWLDSGDGQKFVCQPSFPTFFCGPEK